MKGKLGAFYTAEASFVLTIGILTLFSLLLLAFYLHDIQILQSEWRSLADRAVSEEWNCERLEQVLSEEQSRLQLLLIRLKGTEVCLSDGLSDNGFRITTQISCPVPFFAEHFFQEIVQKERLEITAERFAPEEAMRILEAAEEVVK